ncbi:MAG: Tad domain-containing protein, partial [Alphaproteobacteria bacterium]
MNEGGLGHGSTKQKEQGKCLRALWAPERGGVAMYLGLSMLFIMPIMAGAISVSQVYTLNTELQQAADA